MVTAEADHNVAMILPQFASDLSIYDPAMLDKTVSVDVLPSYGKDTVSEENPWWVKNC